eukprot:3424754-Pleurochrysis_carterae.AAC.1
MLYQLRRTGGEGSRKSRPPQRSSHERTKATCPGQVEWRRSDGHGEGADQVGVVVHIRAGPPQPVQVWRAVLAEVVIWGRPRVRAADA